MSYAPSSLLALRSYLKEHTGLSTVSLGIVGDSNHLSGYHLGRDRIYDGTGPGQGDADYSVRTARDRSGLTNAAMAIDIGNFARLRAMSVWLVSRCRANAPGTRDIREVIYSPDGQTVLRWDRERGINSDPRPGEADSSHRTHTHVSFYRDSESRSKVEIFVPFFEPQEEVMDLFSTGGKLRTFPVGTPVFKNKGDTTPVSTLKSADTVYALVAQDAKEDENVKWYLIDGGGDEKRMAWVKA